MLNDRLLRDLDAARRQQLLAGLRDKRIFQLPARRPTPGDSRR